MAILDRQMRLRELGRFRMGHVQDGRPVKLDKLRFTSADLGIAKAAAALWGGDVKEWLGPNGPAYEVFLEADEVKIVLPPTGEPFTQWYETWTKGGAQHRCDGYEDQITEGPCPCAAKAGCSPGEACPPAKRECKPITRLSMVAPELPGLGVVVLSSTGWNAAVEIPTALAAIAAAREHGEWLTGHLGIERRKSAKGGTTRDFVVPYIRLDIVLENLLGDGRTPGTRVIEAPASRPAVVQIAAGPALEVIEGGGETLEPQQSMQEAVDDSASSASVTEADPPSASGELTNAQRRALFAKGRGLGISTDKVRAIARMVLGHGLSEAQTAEFERMKVALQKFADGGEKAEATLADWLAENGSTE